MRTAIKRQIARLAAQTYRLASDEPPCWPARSLFGERDVDSILCLFFCSHLWVWRRMETFALLDRTAVRREIRLDIELPPWTCEAGHGIDRLFLVPVGLFDRLPLGNLRLIDHSTGSITTLNREEDDQLLAQLLHRICGPAASLKQCKLAVRQRAFGELTACTKGLCLDRQILFNALKCDVANSDLMVAVVPARPHQRRLLTISYEERLHDIAGRATPESDLKHLVDKARPHWPAPRPDWFTRLADWASGYRSRHLVWLQWSLGDVVSTHIEIESPPELEVTDAYLVGKLRGGSLTAVPAREVGARAFLTARPQGADEPVRNTFWSRGEPGVFSAVVRARAPSILTAGLALAFGTAALLGAGALLMQRLVTAGATDAMATILVIAPALTAGFLAARREHEFASSLLRAVRARIATIGVVAIVAATALAFAGARDTTRLSLSAPSVAPAGKVQAKDTKVVSATVSETAGTGTGSDAWLRAVWGGGALVCAVVALMIYRARALARLPPVARDLNQPNEGRVRLPFPDPSLFVKSGEGQRSASGREADALAQAACRVLKFPHPPGTCEPGRV